MATLSLTSSERAELERLTRQTDDADQLRRVNALLALADGQGPRPRFVLTDATGLSMADYLLGACEPWRPWRRC